MHYLTEYQTFQSKQQLNEAIADHLSAHHYELSETVREVLNTIARYAVKFAGAAHLKAATLAELIGKSEKTIRRAINRLQDLRIIHKVATTRKVTGGQGANIYQILPVTTVNSTRNERLTGESHDQAEVSKRQGAVEPVVSSGETIENGTEPYPFLKQNTVINNNSYCAPNAYKAFKQSVNYFVNDSQLTNKLYGIFLAQTSYIKHCYESSELLDCGIEAVMTTFKATKLKPIRNMAGYYHGVLDRVLDRLMTEVFR